METSKRVKIGIIFAGWLAMVGFDLFFHAGVLAKFYTQPSPFLLSPEDAFIRIPLGYISFLFLALLLYWIMQRLDIRDLKNGLKFGLIFGCFMGGASSIGLFSISTISISLVTGWWLGQMLELGIVGAVIGLGLSGKQFRILFLWVGLFVIIMIVMTVVLQMLGFAPPMKQI